MTTDKIVRHRRMMAICLSFIICHLSFCPAWAQYEATVVDAVTHERLPFASVYVDGETSTITNAVGTFSIDCAPTDILRITYVGYKTTYIKAGQLDGVVSLQPQNKQLQEVVVIPIKVMINRICKETLRLQRKYRRRESNFFYRQTAFVGAHCYEFAESFLKGNPAVALHSLRLYTGRYAGIQSDSANHYTFFGNFYTFSQLEMAANYMRPSTIDDVVPLFRNYDKFYDVSYSVIDGDDGERILAIRFEPKPETLKKYPVLSGTLYVDEATLHIRRFEGEGHNFRVMTRTLSNIGGLGARYIRETTMARFSYVVEMTEEHGYPEVQSVYVDESHEYKDQTITTRSLLFNLGNDMNIKKKKGNVLKRIGSWFADQYSNGSPSRMLDFNDELHKVIQSKGYDPEFWQKNEIVRRTPVEQEVLQLFERNGLFGVMQ